MTESESFLDGKVILHAGDCLDVMPTLEPNSIDACVCDPPYGLVFMGKAWDHGVPGVPYWKAVFRLLKPGGHLAAFGGTRTHHRMACAIEDAGFECRDCLSWNFGSGFPKSLNISIEYEKRLCEQRQVGEHTEWFYISDGEKMLRAPPFRDDDANEWAGYGTALKPAMELICLARKPLSESTVAANVLKHGTGALNIDGCRVGYEEGGTIASNPALRIAKGHVLRGRSGGFNGGELEDRSEGVSQQGRWPANVIHDGSDEVVGAFPESASRPFVENDPGTRLHDGGIGHRLAGGFSDSGSAARFFYTAKADADDRLGSKHPTVKPLDLMQWLVRLVTPPKGLVLDPFAGTGTTGEAAWREGMRAVLIEREPEYQEDIRRRMAHALAGPQERKRTIAKAKNPTPPNDGLFASLDAGDAG